MITQGLSPCPVGRTAGHNAASHFNRIKRRCVISSSLVKRPEDGAVLSVALPKPTPRTSLRLGLPSKGRMAEDTMALLKESALSVYKPNPRQYVATIPQIPELEVWFQRASDVVRKLRFGDLDIGIVGYDMFLELGENDPALVLAHEALDFGHCRLGLGIPMTGRFAHISTFDQLAAMPDWTPSNPLRVVTGYHSIARNFFSERGFTNFALVSADGALEAVPAMGSADIILDLISTGVTLRENNLKEIEGGAIVQSQGILVANRNALLTNPRLLRIVHELIERFDGHLKAGQYYSVIANMKGDSPEEVAERLLKAEGLQGLQGPTVSNVYTLDGDTGKARHNVYAATICVRKKHLYNSTKSLQKLGGTGVLVQPMTYIFDEEPERWAKLLHNLGLDGDAVKSSFDSL